MTEPTQLDNQFTTRERNRRFLDNLAKPSDTVTDPAERQKVRFLATIILVIAGLTAVNLPVRLLSGSAFERPIEFITYVLVSLALFAAYALSRTAYYRWAPFIAIVALTSTVYASFFLSDPPSQSSFLFLVVVVLFASAILSNRDTFLFAAGNIAFLLLGPLFIPSMEYAFLGQAIGLLIICTTLIFVSNLHRNRVEEIRQQELKTANQQLQTFSQFLEERVQERTNDLALASEVGRVISQIRDLDDLLQQAVTLIRERFDLYYTQVYLIDESGQRLLLRAGTGTVGQTLLAQQHSLPVDEHSINGRAVAHQKPVIVPDTESSDFFRPNPALPATRSEMAVPLLVQDRVVGVVDLQSSQPNALTAENLPAFTALAGQLAIAIANARLLTEMQETTGFLDSVIENIPLMLFVKDATDLRHVRWNRTGEMVTGYSKEAFIGKNDYDFFPREEAEFFVAKDREVLNSGQLVEIAEEPLQSAHRGTRLLHTTKVPIFDAYGRPKYLLGISEDITERKQIEAQLAERLKQLNLLNEIGRKAEEVTNIDEFMAWITWRVPQTMGHPEACIAAVTMGQSTFGDAQAIEMPRHMVEDLSIRGELVGRIHIAYIDNTLNFRDEDSAIIGGVGRRVSSYIENQRLLGQLQAQAENLQKVAAISTAVAASRNSYQLAQEVAELTQRSFALYQTALFLVEENELVLTGAAGAIGIEASSQSPRISRQTVKSLVARAARLGQGILINDVTAEPDFMAHPLLPETKSEIVTPLLVGDQVLGVLDIQANTLGAFTAEDLNIFTTLASQTAVALQNARQYEQTQAALEELSSLQRVITGENWETFMSSRQQVVQGYVANRQTVQPIMASAKVATVGEDGAIAVPDLAGGDTFVIPVQVRGTTIGKLGVHKGDLAAISPENEALLTAIAQQVAEALERARLFEETEIARAQTDQLFAGSERVVRATTLDEVLQAVIQSTSLQQLDRVNMMFFDKPWGDSPPDTMTITALWEKSGEPSLAPIGTVYKVADTPFLSITHADMSTIVSDIMTDERVDEATRTILSRLGTRGLAVFPLTVGREWLGIITCHSHTAIELGDAAVRQISSLVDQAATVAQTQRLFEAVQARAQQEQILRRVSERVYTAVDAESVLRTAVQEVGRVLGLEAFVYLENTVTAVPETGPLVEKATNGTNGRSQP